MILKDKTLNLQGIKTFSKIHFYSKIINKKSMSCIWTIITIGKKNCSNIHLYEKVIFGQKDMLSFLKVTLLVYFILFIPIPFNFIKENS